jgi:hypothetical protein
MSAIWFQLLQDLRYAGRTMAAQPLCTAMATLPLALGIGANTAIYSFMDASMMRALPVEESLLGVSVSEVLSKVAALLDGSPGNVGRNGHCGTTHAVGFLLGTCRGGDV